MKFLEKLGIVSTPSFLYSPSKVVISHILVLPKSVSLSTSSSSDDDDDVETQEHMNSLTQEEITEINLVIPRLCLSNHLPEAIRLVDAALVANPNPNPIPPLKSLSVSILINRLSAEPDLTQPMSFLNRLKHNPPAHPSLLPITKMLLFSYFNKAKKPKVKEAMKILNWMSRPDSPCFPDSVVYAIVVNGFCRNRMVFDALKVVRAMVGANLVPGSETRMRIYRALLSEARIREAQMLDEALGSISIWDIGGDRNNNVKKKKLSEELLDRIIANWVE